MKKALFVLLVLLAAHPALAQVKGKVTAKNGNPVPFASIIVAGTYNGTSTNDNGRYTLNIRKKGHHTIIFQSLGYKTQEIETDIASFPHTLNVTLETEEYSGEETAQNSDNTAKSVIKNAIRNRKANAQKITGFEADYYSKGIFRLKNVPKKILGQKLGDFGASVDSSGTGLLYLSETVSKVKYLKPGKISERVIASKISGEDSGFSYNNAAAADFNFYRTYLPFEVNVVSPIAGNAFSHYKYQLENTFRTSSKHLIYKIKVIPRSKRKAAMYGHIYIIDGSWELYAVDLSVKGSQIKQDLLNTLTIRQNFGYNREAGLWTRNTQTIDFDAGLMGVGYEGRFTSVYSNFTINPQFEKGTFTAEIQSFEADANKKSDTYWNERPIPLTDEEKEDYRKKDSVQAIAGTKAYMDALDKERNKFKLLSVPVGYTYRNSYENWQIKYTGIIKRLGFNTVQAYALGPGFHFTQFHNREKTSYTTIGTDLNYGFAEQRFRATGTISHKFDDFTKRIITLSGGSTLEQYNQERPINRIVNSISTLFFRDNYMKLYDNTFVRLNYEEEVANGLYLYASGEYARRRHAFNTTNFSTLKDKYKPYTSNNPLLLYDPATESDNVTPAFEKHTLFKASLGTRITFGQKYKTTPTGKENIADTRFPRLYIKYEKGFAASVNDYNFDHLSAKVNYDLVLGNKGELGTSFRAGKFFNSENIAFTDYKHFNGNQTHVGRSERYLNVFNLLPYYSHSTNDQYFEMHAEHNFQGYLTNSIPLFNKLNYYLVAGYHMLATPQHNPYMEFTVGLDNVGWGKARFLRVDYVRSYESGFVGNGVIFGLTFLDILE